MATRIVLTYAGYAAIPNDGKRYELHDGDLSVAPAPGTRHQTVVLNLAMLLSRHVMSRQPGQVFISPIDCILSDTTVVQPDVVYVESARRAIVSERGIEIDRVVKAQLYARHGVPYYWIVDAEPRALQASEPSGDAYRPAGSLEGACSAALPPFPDLVLEPAAIWP